MTTTTDPYGTPETFFNRSGVTVQEFILVTGHALYPTNSISGHSIFILRANGALYPPEEGIILPSNAIVGDIVEVFNLSNGVIGIIPPSGENISGNPASEVSASQRRRFFKYSTTSWVQSS